MSQTVAGVYEQFATEVQRYGVGVNRVPPKEVTETIAAVLEPPAVGVSLPWEDTDLPDSVTTEPTPAEIESAVTGVTAAANAIADYGSIVLRSDEQGSEPISLFNDRHVAVLREEDIMADMTEAFSVLGEQFRESRDSAILATGPSATADMGALVQGAHGPKEVEVIVVT